MYARSTTVRGNPEAMDEGIAYVRDTVMPSVKAMDGCVGLSMLCDAQQGHCIVPSSLVLEGLKTSKVTHFTRRVGTLITLAAILTVIYTNLRTSA